MTVCRCCLTVDYIAVFGVVVKFGSFVVVVVVVVVVVQNM